MMLSKIIPVFPPFRNNYQTVFRLQHLKKSPLEMQARNLYLYIQKVFLIFT